MSSDRTGNVALGAKCGLLLSEIMRNELDTVPRLSRVVVVGVFVVIDIIGGLRNL